MIVYLACYSERGAPRGASGNGTGIVVLRCSPNTGSLSVKETLRCDVSPSWLAYSPCRSFVFAVNEMDNFEGKGCGSVSSFARNQRTGMLQQVNTVSSGGAGPAHISVHPSGRYVFVANYESGTVSMLPIAKSGRLGAARDVKEGWGPMGNKNATNAPNGSYALRGHEAPHAHMVLPDPSGRHVLSSDLARDRVFVWRVNLAKGRLYPQKDGGCDLPSGDGPRHFAFHPNGVWLYCLQEEASTLAFCKYESKQGKLTVKQTVSTLPKQFAGTSFASGLILSEDGKFLYAANRLHDSIAWFAIRHDGWLIQKGETWARGDYPRSLSLTPGDRFLYSCNQRSDAITVFKREKENGSIRFTGQYVPVGSPSMILM